MFEGASIMFAAAGVAVFVAAILPKALRNAPISMPMVFLGAGAGAFGLLPTLPDPSPVQHSELTLHLTEVCVIISLMGAGLALDRPVGRRNWATTWRMLGIAMPLCMLGLTLLGLWLLGLGLAAALLVAAALVPDVLTCCVAGHRSHEPGAAAALDHLGLVPVLDLGMRLGEGSGACLALPIVEAAARLLREMATFDSAGVSEK